MSSPPSSHHCMPKHEDDTVLLVCNRLCCHWCWQTNRYAWPCDVVMTFWWGLLSCVDKTRMSKWCFRVAWFLSPCVSNRGLPEWLNVRTCTSYMVSMAAFQNISEMLPVQLFQIETKRTVNNLTSMVKGSISLESEGGLCYFDHITSRATNGLQRNGW